MYIERDIEELYENLVHKVKQNIKWYDADILNKAFFFAYKKHSWQYSFSGEPYIKHVIGTSEILAELSVEMSVLIWGILHGMLRKTNVEEEELKKLFWIDITKLVIWFDKLSSSEYKQWLTTRDLSFLKQLFQTGWSDIRVFLIKIAERIDASSMIGKLPEKKQQLKAQEIIDIYVPLIRILGIWKYIWNIEDVCYQYLDPIEYSRLFEVIGKKRPELERRIESLSKFMSHNLHNYWIASEISGRIKTIYSISRKIKKKHIPLSWVYDLLALRIIVKEVSDAYRCLWIIHWLYKSKENRIKDYISSPKPNGYQSIHTVVTDEDWKPFEIQIQTEEMYAFNMFGLASHNSYKWFSNDHKSFPQWMKDLRNQQKKSLSWEEFLEQLHPSILKWTIICTTPKWDEIELPKKSTILDFAFYIHLDIWHRVLGAWINWEYVENLMYTLIDGDNIELEVGEEDNDYPVKYLWHLKTSVAIRALKADFKGKSKEKRIQLWKHLLDEQMEFIGYKPFLKMPNIVQKGVTEAFNMQDSETLLLDIWSWNVNVNKVVHVIYNLKHDSHKYKSTVSLKVLFKKRDAENINKLFDVFHNLDIQIISITYKNLESNIDFHVKDLTSLHELSSEISRIWNVKETRRIFTRSVWVFLWVLSFVSWFIILSPFVLFYLRKEYSLWEWIFTGLFYLSIVFFVFLLYFFKYVATVTLPWFIKRKAFWIWMFALNTCILITVTLEAIYIFDMKNTVFLLSFTLCLYGLTIFEYLDEKED